MEAENKLIDLKKARMPRHYAQDLADRFNVSRRKVYAVKGGDIIDKRIKLELLRIVAISQEEEARLDQAILTTEKRIINRKATNQLSMF